MRYEINIELGGVAGVMAPPIGKQPPKVQIWILGGQAPAFVREEGPRYQGGPIWSIQLASPVWPAPPRPRLLELTVAWLPASLCLDRARRFHS